MEPKLIDWTPEMAVKQGYPHFMLKEIHEQPVCLRNTLRLQEHYLDLMATFLDRAREVFLVACGTSYHACLAERVVVGNWNRHTVMMDFDDMGLSEVKYWCFRACKRFRLKGFIILESSVKKCSVKVKRGFVFEVEKPNYHAVFDRRVSWEFNVKVMNWIAFGVWE